MKLIGILGPTKFEQSEDLKTACEIISKSLIENNFGAVVTPESTTWAKQ